MRRIMVFNSRRAPIVIETLHLTAGRPSPAHLGPEFVRSCILVIIAWGVNSECAGAAIPFVPASDDVPFVIAFEV